MEIISRTAPTHGLQKPSLSTSRREWRADSDSQTGGNATDYVDLKQLELNQTEERRSNSIWMRCSCRFRLQIAPLEFLSFTYVKCQDANRCFHFRVSLVKDASGYHLYDPTAADKFSSFCKQILQLLCFYEFH